jgi:metal-responsive CopG/Arc/MetJ family transcriptional regulator
MSTTRAHVVLPEDLVREIDKILGKRGRSAFLADLAQREIRRRRMVKILKSKSQSGRTKITRSGGVGAQDARRE